MDSILRELDESIFKDAVEDVLDSSSPLPSSSPYRNAHVPTHSSPIDDCCKLPRFESLPLPKDPENVIIDDLLLSCDSALDEILHESCKRFAFNEGSPCIEVKRKKKRKQEFENTQPAEFNFDFEF